MKNILQICQTTLHSRANTRLKKIIEYLSPLDCRAVQSTRIVGSVQLCTISATDHIGHKPYRPRPHRPHEKTISAERNNHIGHKKMYCCGYYVICGCSGCPFTSYIIIYWLHCRDCRRRATCHPQYTGQVFTARHRPDISAEVML